MPTSKTNNNNNNKFNIEQCRIVLGYKQESDNNFLCLFCVSQLQFCVFHIDT